MVILSNSGNTAFKTEEIASINFVMKLNQKNKIYKRNGHYAIDKTKIDIIFKSGVRIQLCTLNEKDGQETFDIIAEAMKKDYGK